MASSSNSENEEQEHSNLPIYTELCSPRYSSLINGRAPNVKNQRTALLNVNPLNIEDFIYAYPSVHSDNLQTKIAGLREFAELQAPVLEKLPLIPYDGLLHQRFVRRYMRFYQRLFLFHGTGTGKTGSAILTAEELLSDPSSGIDHIYFLTSGKFLIEDFIQQLVCKFTPTGKYKSTSDVKNVYTITTYGKFAQEIANMVDRLDISQSKTGITPVTVYENLGNQHLRNHYSGSLFIVDEVQNLRANAPLSTNAKKKRRHNNYYYIHRLFHVALRSKFLVMSATPMTDTPDDNAQVMNLLLPLNRQMPLQCDYEKINTQQLRIYYHGLVSYIRSTNTGALVIDEGKKISGQFRGYHDVPVNFTTKLVPSEMSEFQARWYIHYYQELKKSNSGGDYGNPFYHKTRHASNFVFPDGSIGNEGLSKFATENSLGQYVPNEQLRPYLSDLKRLQQLSAKFATIIRIANKSPGVAMAYTDYRRASGPDVLGMILRYQGYEQFLEDNSVFIGDSGENISTGICRRDDAVNRQVRGNFYLTGTVRPDGKMVPPRFAILHSNTPTNIRRNIIEVLTSEENRHGEIIKLVLGSKVTGLGINIYHGRQFHAINSWWNESRNRQSRNRILRATSHEALIEEERLAAEREGRPPRPITVQIFRHVASLPEKYMQYAESIDERMYLQANIKDYFNARITRVLKEKAIDCLLNRDRNIRPQDQAYGEDCDYQECNYQCADPAPTAVDDTNYDILYTGKIIEDLVNKLQELFRYCAEYTYSQLYELWPQYKARYIQTAVNKLIVERQILYNRFGYPCLVKEQGELIFLIALNNEWDTQYNKSMANSYSGTEYVSNQTIRRYAPLSELLTRYRYIYDQNILPHLLNITAENQHIVSNYINQVSIDMQSFLLEQSIIAILNTQLQAQGKELMNLSYAQLAYANSQGTIRAADLISNKYRNNWYQFIQPDESLMQVANTIANPKSKPGRKPRLQPHINNIKINHIAMVVPEQGNLVYIQTVKSLQKQQTSYSVTTQKGINMENMRILRPNEGSWRNVNLYEYLVYNKLIQERESSIKERLNELPIYGSIGKSDDKFRIHENLGGPRRGKNAKRGAICKNKSKGELIRIMYYINQYSNKIPQPSEVQQFPDRAKMLQYLLSKNAKYTTNLNQLSDAEVRYYYVWFVLDYQNEQLCRIIFETLQSLGWMLTS